MQVYLVGGAVRDHLLGITNKDKDWVVVGSTPAEMLSLGYQQVGADFPVFLHPNSKDEYALARKERKSGRGYQGFICDFSPDISLVDDLQRRDLTINAMAIDEQGKVIDPFGGQADLHNKQLRHVSAAFGEDPLRVLRVARFSARFYPCGFRVAASTLQLMQAMADSGELSSLTPERVWQETARALAESHPDIYFRTLAAAHALAPLFPEIAGLFGVAMHLPLAVNSLTPGADQLPVTADSPATEQVADAGEHALQALTAAATLSTSTDTRFAALLHGVGRAKTTPNPLAEADSLEETSAALIQTLCQRLKTPKSTRALALLVARHGHKAQLAPELTADDIISLLDACDVWRRPERFEQFLQAVEAVTRASQTGLSPATSSTPYGPQELLRKAAKSAREIDTKALLKQGYQGLALKQQIRLMRANKISSICG